MEGIKNQALSYAGQGARLANEGGVALGNLHSQGTEGREQPGASADALVPPASFPVDQKQLAAQVSPCSLRPMKGA